MDIVIIVIAAILLRHDQCRLLTVCDGLAPRHVGLVDDDCGTVLFIVFIPYHIQHVGAPLSNTITVHSSLVKTRSSCCESRTNSPAFAPLLELQEFQIGVQVFNWVL
jgi:hypothetical protein